MDFKRLPNIIALKILHYLPLKNQVRIARVSRRFQELSTMAISTTTELRLFHGGFMGADLENLLHLSAGSLKKILININRDPDYELLHESIFNERVELISQLQHPQLTDLVLRQSHTEAETVRQLLINCPNIRRLVVYRDEFPSSNAGNAPTATCETMESLEIEFCPDDMVNFYVDMCPRLKRLSLTKQIWTWDQLVRGLNQIIGKYLDLEQLELSTSQAERIEGISNLWRLSSLRSLSLDHFIVDEHTTTEISNRLVQLEEVTITTVSQEGLQVWRDIAPLSGLKNLRKLTYFPFGLEMLETDPLFLDQGIYHLNGHQRLECIHVLFQLSSATVVTLAQSCPRLNQLITTGIGGIDSKTKAKQFVKRLRGFIQEKLPISFMCIHGPTDHVCMEEIWHSNTVQSAVSRINAASNGRSISINVRHYILHSSSLPWYMKI